MKKYIAALLYITLICSSLFAQRVSYCMKGVVSSDITDFTRSGYGRYIGKSATIEFSYDTSGYKLLERSANGDMSDYLLKNGYLKISFADVVLEPLPDKNECYITMYKNRNTKDNYGRPIIRDEIQFVSINNNFPMKTEEKYKVNRLGITWSGINVLENTTLSQNVDYKKFDLNTSDALYNIFDQSFSGNIMLLMGTNIQSVEKCELPTSFEVITSNAIFSLTPNPSTTGRFHIEGEATNIQVYNAQGYNIVPNLINPNTLDLSAFPKGMYVVVAKVNGTVFKQKVILE